MSDEKRPNEESSEAQEPEATPVENDPAAQPERSDFDKRSEAAAASVGRPYSGFPVRALAFIVDCIVIFFAGKLLNDVFRPQLLALNPWLPWLGHLFILAYFWLGNGPVGRGRTLGKLIVNMQVVDARGESLDWASALKRALLQHIAFFMVIDDLFYYAMFAPHQSVMTLTQALLILQLAGLSYLIAQVLAVALHPRNQAWHDRWAGSYVTRYPTPAAFDKMVSAPLDPLGERRAANHLWIPALFWLMTLGILGYGAIDRFHDEFIPIYEDGLILQTQIDFQMPIQLEGAAFPTEPNRLRTLGQIRSIRQREAVADQDVTTTATLIEKGLNPYAINSRAYVVRNAFHAEWIETDFFREDINRLREMAWERWNREILPREVAERDPETPPANEFSLIIIEPFKLGLYTSSRPRLWIRGPADPALGPLEFEIVQRPTPPTTETQTTATPYPGEKLRELLHQDDSTSPPQS